MIEDHLVLSIKLFATLALVGLFIVLGTFFGAIPRVHATTTRMTWQYGSISPAGSKHRDYNRRNGIYPPLGYTVLSAFVEDTNDNFYYASESKPIACGSSITFVYPTDFTSSPTTSICGTYESGFGIVIVETQTTYAQDGDSFSVTGCPNGVPEFPIASLSFLLLIALLLPALFLMGRKFRAITGKPL